MANLSDENLLNEFVVESRDHLSSIEPDLLVLEREGKQAGQEIINRVFRAIHSIKGAAGFFGLNALKNLSHVMESVLMLIRDGKLDPSPEVMDPLLVGVDKLRAMLDDIQASEQIPCADEIAMLEKILGITGASSTETIPVQQAVSPTEDSSGSKNKSKKQKKQFPATFMPDRLSVESAVKQGQHLLSVQVLLDDDLTAKDRNPLDFMNTLLSAGSILDTLFDIDAFSGLKDCLKTNLSVLFLYASVLDEDLIATMVDIPAGQVKKLEVAELLSDANAQQSPPEVQSTAPEAENEMPAEGSMIESNPQPEQKPAPKPDQPGTAGTSSPESVETVRVRIDLLNKLMDLAGEMVLSRNQLKRTLERDASRINGLASILQNVDLITSDLQEHIMQTRMQPIASVFGKFPRIVRDMSRQLGKEIQLEMIGEDVELDKSIIESLSDPLTHLIRNCCDHALETPDERLKSGKNRVGLIQLHAYHESGQINISITDDGRGIDVDKIVRKAISNGAISEAEVRKMSQQELVNLVFLPGLSTAEKVTDISGRGVGMDVVRTNIEKLGGTITIETAIGKGTKMLLRLPLTLAIIPSLIVGVAGERFAIPQINLLELVRVSAAEVSSRLEKVGTATVLRLRGKLLPLVRLADILELERDFIDPETQEAKPDRRAELADIRQSDEAVDKILPNRRRQRESDCNILVLRVGAHQYGLVVDELSDTEEIVVKPMPGYLKNCKCFAGATIMGDGRVAMILDAGGILSYAKLTFSEIDEEERRRRKQDAHGNTDQTQAVLLFNNAMHERFAIPLSSILRLEKFEPDKIESMGGREYITYRGKGLPLIRLENHLPVTPAPEGMKEMYLIIPKSEHALAGIVASQILDTTEAQKVLDKNSVTCEGISGSAVVCDHLTLFIEPEGLLSRAGISHQEVCHV